MKGCTVEAQRGVGYHLTEPHWQSPVLAIIYVNSTYPNITIFLTHIKAMIRKMRKFKIVYSITVDTK